jgi:MoxR-like ATPase
MAAIPQAAHEDTLPTRLSRLARSLQDRYLGKDEVIRLLIVAAIAGEHAVLIGPPGTAKSALIRTFARLMHARYFEYLLTRFTEPNEIFGPVDIAAFREGRYERRTEGMLPDAEVVFLDEVFKSNSAILNALLTLLNERRYTSGGQVIKCPLLSAFGASNEVPTDETLTAIYDRFILRIRNDNLDAYHFQDLLQKGLEHEVLQMTDAPVQPLVSARELAELQRGLLQRTRFGEDFFSQYKGIVFQIRAEGVSLSDRRVVKILKLFAASAYLDGRPQPDASDFFVLKHV